jgi:hypothetical protein
MWAAGQALAAALRAQAPRRLAQRAPAQRLAAALSPTLCDVWGARFASAAADAGAAVPPDGAAASTRLGGADWLGAEGSGAAVARERNGSASGEASQAEPPLRRQRAPYPTRGEKTADGRPKPDERTVADLVGSGWFESEEAVVALLTRGKTGVNRYAFETAQPTADWLEAMLGLVPAKGGVLPAAKAVNLFPELLYRDAAALQRKWGALTQLAEQGGVGIALSEEQACEAVLKHPQLLGYAADALKRGWSMLTATEGGLGLSPEEARSCILLNPAVLRFNHDAVVRRVELLRSLGYPKAHRMVLRQSRVLSFTEETVREHAAWWKQTGLDHVKIVTMNPTLLGVVSVDELQAKLDFLSVVVGMSTAELNNAPSLFGLSLDDRLRARYFYALQEGRLARFGSINTMMSETDTSFLAMLEGQPSRGRATDLEVACYKEQVASPEFVAWRERQEALLVRDAQLRSAKALARIRQDVCALHP